MSELALAMGIEKIPIKDMEKAEWLAERKKSLGGSDMAADLGLNPYKSAYALWAEKTDRVPEFTGNMATKVGLYLEDMVAQLFTEESGKKVQRTNYIYRNRAFPWMHASPDRLLVGEKSGLEIKTTSALNLKRFKHGSFPEEYYAQSAHYMAVLEYDRWYIAVLIGNNQFHIYQLTAIKDDVKPDWCECSLYVDDGEVRALIDSARKFYEDSMVNDKPPLPDGSESTADTIATIYADGMDNMVDLTGYERTVDEMQQIEMTIKNLGKRKDALKQELQCAMGSAERAVCGPYKLSWKNSERRTFDSKAFIEQNPGNYEPWYKVSNFRTFRMN